jgi:iron(III) transport system permease protein
VYLVARASLATQGARLMEASRLLGLTPARAVLRVALPLAAPAIAGGTVLASMETLADFGTVAAFNYDTFTTAIYKAWFALFSIDSALQLAGMLVVLAALLLWLQSRAQGRRSFVQTGAPAARIPLRGIAGVCAVAVCALVLLAAFAVPASQLVAWSLKYAARDLDARLIGAAGRSVALGLTAAVLTAVAAVLLAYAARRSPGRFTRIAVRLATLGYAAPGALLAIGLFVPVAALLRWTHAALGVSTLLEGGLLLMLLAYLVRFSAVAHAPVSAGLQRIRPSLDEAAQLAGVTGLAQLTRVHLPLLRPGLAAAVALVFVDVMKEMPITLMTRPFGWDTLSVRVFELTSEGEWQRAALPSLAIVAAGLVPVWLLTRTPSRGT